MKNEIIKKSNTKSLKLNEIDKIVVSKKVNLSSLLIKENINDVSKALKSKLPSLANLRMEYGEETVKMFLKKLIIDINYYTNISNKMDSEQIKITADLIMQDFYFLKISDLALIAKRFIKGSYGELYNVLSSPKILAIFSRYFEERCLYASDENLRKHQDLKSYEIYEPRVSNKTETYISPEIYKHLNNKKNGNTR